VFFRTKSFCDRCIALAFRCMVARPYMSHGVVELEELFKTSTEPDVLQDLYVELSIRTTSKAKKLLALVNIKLGTKTLPNADVAILQIELDDLQKRYRSLRDTFTLEGEILARWGMTAAIPRDVEEKVFELWTKLVSVEEDDFGRSVISLQRDIKILKEERIGMDPEVFSDSDYGD
jgi:hypothetical protein